MGQREGGVTEQSTKQTESDKEDKDTERERETSTRRQIKGIVDHDQGRAAISTKKLK
jgi:hypothetical protein